MQNTIHSFIERYPPVIPVVTLRSHHDALPLAEALLAGGISAVEITLRTPAGIEGIQTLKTLRKDLFICAGSIISLPQMEAAILADVDLLVTPGINKILIQLAQDANITILPGISNASDILLGIECGVSIFKFFPAELLGGLKYLNSLSEPFPHCQFCPTGGITADNFTTYLNSPKVAFVAGSFIANTRLIEEKNWRGITKQCEKILRLLPTKQPLIQDN